MFKYFSANNTRKFVAVLDLLVDQYNYTIHSSTKITPKEASRKENENKVWRIFIQNLVVIPWLQNFRLVIMLEKQRKRKHFIKDTLKHGRKRFTKFQLTISVTYKITDYNGEEIQGSFYEQELQKTKHDI